MEISTRFTKRILLCLSMFFLLTSLAAPAQADFFVIPVSGKPLKNIVTVAKANGNFTDPVAAVNSIIDASASNPYLVVIGPGVYTITQTLVTKPYVDIAGSGENVTKLQGAISTGNWNASSAIISGANNATLSFLTVENTGGSGYSIALYNNHASTMLRNVTAMASGGIYNHGIYNDFSSPTMTDVTAAASGGTGNYGVYNYSSAPTMENVTTTASGGSSYGVANYNASSPRIRRSTIKGDTYSLLTGLGSTSWVSQSTITDGVTGTGTYKCVACDNDDGVALGENCL